MSNPAYTLVVRCGREGGGKGALVAEDLSMTLSTGNTQVLFQPLENARHGEQGSFAKRNHYMNERGDSCLNPQEQPRNNPLTYISIFSGIEAASVAWEPLGFKPLAFAEVDPFPSAVLKERFPHVPNLGDVTKIDWSEHHGKVDIIVGGSPCQSFSIAGKREGLKGESGLMFQYIRAVREVMPRYFVWENVPGALSSEGGEAFRQLLSEMDDLGYGLAWRVLDAQFFGVAQRRRRVFLVGCLGSAERASEILFEPDSLRWDHPPSREKREELARAARDGAQKAGGAASISGNVIGRKESNGGNQVGINEEDLSFTLTTADVPAVCPEAGPLNPWDNQTSRVYHKDGIAPTLLSNNAGGYKGGCVLGPAAARSSAFIYHGSSDARGIGYEEEQSPTLTSEGKPPAISFAQNTRDEVRLVGGDGSIAGCLSAQTGAKQQTYVAERIASEGQTAFSHSASGSRGFAKTWEMSPTLRTCTNNTSNMPAVCVTQYGEEVAGTLTARGDSSPCADRGQNIICGCQEKETSCNREDLIARASSMSNAETMVGCCPTQTARQHKDPPIVCMADDNAKAAIDVGLCGALKVGGSAPISSNGYAVRRLIPLECERLQGFPDEWTRIAWRGKPAEECPDTPRYKAIGNSMAVPVMQWIGRRLMH